MKVTLYTCSGDHRSNVWGQERKAAQMDEMRKQAAEEAAGSVNYKAIEDEEIAALLAPLSLRVRQVCSS